MDRLIEEAENFDQHREEERKFHEDELEYLQTKRRNTKTSQSRPADLITTDAQKAAHA